MCAGPRIDDGLHSQASTHCCHMNIACTARRRPVNNIFPLFYDNKPQLRQACNNSLLLLGTTRLQLLCASDVGIMLMMLASIPAWGSHKPPHACCYNNVAILLSRNSKFRVRICTQTPRKREAGTGGRPAELAIQGDDIQTSWSPSLKLAMWAFVVNSK